MPGVTAAAVVVEPPVVTLSPDGSATVSLNSTIPGGTNLGAWIIDLSYDQTLVTAIECTSSVSTCNPTFAANTTRIVGAALPGLTGSLTLADLTFRAVEVDRSSPLTVTIAEFTDSSGDPIPASPTSGSITVRGPV